MVKISSFLSLAFASVVFCPPAIAQILHNRINTPLNIDSDRLNLRGEILSGHGSGLPYRLEALGLNGNSIANFMANPITQTILERLKGSNVSVLEGLLQTSNLKLDPSQGGFSTPDRQLSISAVPGSSLLEISQLGHLLKLEVQPQTLGTHASPNLPQLLTGNHAVGNASRLQANLDGTVSLTGSGLRIDPKTGITIGSASVGLNVSDRNSKGSNPSPANDPVPAPNPIPSSTPNRTSPFPKPSPTVSNPNSNLPSNPSSNTPNSGPVPSSFNPALQSNSAPLIQQPVTGLAPIGAQFNMGYLPTGPETYKVLQLDALQPPPPGPLDPISSAMLPGQPLPGILPPPGSLSPSLDGKKIAPPPPPLGSFQAMGLPPDKMVPLLDKHLGQEFTNYLGLPPYQVVKTVDDVQDTLTTVEKLTGVKSAFVYVNFVPTTANSSSENADSDHLELVMMTAHGVPVRKRLSQATRQQVIKIAQALRQEVSEPRNIGTTSYLAPAQQIYQWLVQPLAVDLESQQINHISFIMDAGLRTLPVSVLHDGHHFIIEKYSVGIIPSLSLTDLRLGNWKRAKIWGLGVSESTQGQIALPSVTTEIKTIIGQLWPGQYYLNQEATMATLKAARHKYAYGIFHLSTHANFNPGAIQNSYIQLWNERLSLDQFRQLGWGDPPVELLTLSACRTAIGNRESELGYAGLSIQSGVKSVVASLWNVSDAGTSALMTQFYDDLRTASTKADALRLAQLSMAQGKVTLKAGQVRGLSFTSALPLNTEAEAMTDLSLSHPYFWSAFTLVGSPW